MAVKCPEKLTAQQVWEILAEYADDVGRAEGILFSDNEYVILAADQYDYQGEEEEKHDITPRSKEQVAEDTLRSAEIRAHHEEQYNLAFQESMRLTQPQD